MDAFETQRAPSRRPTPRPRRVSCNTLVHVFKRGAVFLRRIYQNINDAEFEKLSREARPLASSLQSVSLYGFDGTIKENILLQSPPPGEISSQDEVTGMDSTLPEEYFIREERMEKLDPSTVEKLVANLKTLCPSKEKAIFVRIEDPLPLYDKWYAWVNEQDVVCFQSNLHYSNKRLENNMYTYGFQVVDETPRHSPAKRKQNAETIRYFFEDGLCKDELYCGLPESALKSLVKLLHTTESFMAAKETESIFNNENMLGIMVRYLKNNPFTHELDMTEHNVTHRVSVDNFTLNIEQFNIQRRRTEGLLQLTFNSRTFDSHLEIVEIQDRIQGKHLTQSEIRPLLFAKGGRYYDLLQQTMLNFLMNQGIYDDVEEDDDEQEEYDVITIHRTYIKFFPHEALKFYNRHNIRKIRIKFFDDNLEPTMEFDAGGPFAEYMTLMAKSLFQPFPKDVNYYNLKNSRVLDMDPKSRFPKFADHVSDGEKGEIAKEVVLFFCTALAERVTIGRVLPEEFFELVLILKDFVLFTRGINPPEYGLEFSSRYFQAVLHVMSKMKQYVQYFNVASFLQSYINFENVTVNGPTNTARFKPYIQEVRDSIKRRVMHPDIRKYIDFRAKIQYVLRFMEDMGEQIVLYDIHGSFEDQDIHVLPPIIFNYVMNHVLVEHTQKYLDFIRHYIIQGEENANRYYARRDMVSILGQKFNRGHIAQCIEAGSGITPYLLTRMEYLKAHILDETTPQEWVQKFLAAVTGSESINSSTCIKMDGIPNFRMPSCHTCVQTLVVFNGPPTEYRYMPTEVSDRQRFLASITDHLIEQSTGFDFV